MLPAPVRKRLRLATGGELVLTVDGSEEVRLVSVHKQVDRCQGMFAARSPKRVLSEELIAERRREARREKRD